MTVDEFDLEFDILYNNIASNAAPSIDKYEKSVLLTQAQRDIVIGLYSGRIIQGVSFESTEEARSYLRELITETTVPIGNSTSYLSKNRYTIELDPDVLFILSEDAYNATENKHYLVFPTRHDFLYKDIRNPFRGPNENRVLRVDCENGIHIYSKGVLTNYAYSYIRKPNPIIIGDDNTDLTIDGSSTKFNSECELNPILHKVILDRAVALAKEAYIGK